MGTTSAGHLSAPDAQDEESNSPRGVQELGGHPQSLFRLLRVRMAELPLHRRHVTALGQPHVKYFLFLLWPSLLLLLSLLGPKCHRLHPSETPGLSGLFWKPAGGYNRNKPTSTRTVGEFSSQTLQSSSFLLLPLRFCRAT